MFLPDWLNSAWVDNRGVLRITGFNLGMSGIPRPPPPMRELKASATACTLTLVPADPLLQGPLRAPPAQPGVKITDGSDQNAIWVDVKVGARERRVVLRKFPSGCPAVATCPPVP